MGNQCGGAPQATNHARAVIRPKVVISGLGLVSSIGNNLTTALESSLEGRSGIGRCDDHLDGEYGAELRCRVAGAVTGFNAGLHVALKHLALHDPATCFAMAAVAEALEDAGLDLSEPLGERTAVVIGAAAPGMRSYHRALRQAYVDRQAHDMRGSVLPHMSGNIPSALVALKYGVTGPTFGVVNACATGATTLSLAADMIRMGRCDRVIAGGIDAPIALATFGSMLSAGAMNPTDDPVRACKPFSRDRAGLIVGEGAGIMVLERAEDALQRGATIYGEMMGEAHTNEAHHIYSPNPTGGPWARTMRLALEQAGLSAQDVDAVSAHAASTPQGDLAETRALKSLFGRGAYDVPVFASKSMLGHTFGAAGAIESILALAALRLGKAPPTINLTQPDPECDLDYVANNARPVDAKILLKNSFGFGGTNTCLVLRIERSQPRLGRGCS